MARRVVVFVSCSFCEQEFQDDGTMKSAVLSVEAGDKFHFDICNSCFLPEGRFGQLLDQGERQAGRGAKRPAEAPKPAAGKYMTKQAREAQQRALKASGSGYPCGEPGCDHIAVAPQGRGAHRKAVHGITAAA